MARFKRGDIVLVPFPFITSSGLEKRKLRPALVFCMPELRRYSDLTLMAISSRLPDKPLSTEIILPATDSRSTTAGLRTSSVFKAEAIMTVPEPLVTRRIGNATVDLLEQIEVAARHALGMNP